MRINAINNNYNADYKYRNINFKNLIKDFSAIPIINKMSESDKIKFNQIEKRLSKTKYWDMKISSFGNKFEEFKFSFINKKDNKKNITDGIHPYSKQNDTIKFYSIVYGPENTSFNNLEILKFKSKERADELYDKYTQDLLFLINRRYNITPIEFLKIKESEINMLEEAAETEEKKHVNKVVTTDFTTKHTIGNNLEFTKD